MKRIIRSSLSSIVLLVLSACSFPSAATAQPVLSGSLTLTVQTQNGVTTFSRAGEVINYNYVVTNTTSSPLAGPVTITDGTRTVTCPDIETVGNADPNLDFNETMTCTLGYTITDADVNTGSVTNIATASVGGVTSNQAGVTLTLVQASGILKLTKAPSPTTYGAAGQTISYNFTITNSGAAPLGPTQFVINDDKLGASLPCGPAATTLQPNQPITCTINYAITQADLGVASITNTATALGAGQLSAPVTATIANITVTATPAPIVTPIVTQLPSSGSTCPTSQQQAAAGSTCLHQVEVGEWLIQIGRCYGVSLSQLVSANHQIQNPNLILPSMLLTVPNLGSAGKIYGRPCITFYTVQSGDTWSSVAQKFNADVVVLQRVNPNGLIVGQPAKIPLNSAGATSVTAAPAPGTATPTGTAPPAAQRITIPAGQTATAIAGIVNPGQTVSYVINAAQGQVLAVSLTGPSNTEVTLGVFGPTGLALKTPDGAFSWNSTITTAGDHTITVTGLGGAPNKNYTLTVSLTAGTTPLAPTPITAVP